MYWLGFSMNTVTLLALSLVIGLLVDDAIVEVENIVRHLRSGKPPLQAAMDAATEIGLAVIATSMTLVAVFLPTAMMGGIPGLIFKQFGWTAVVAVLASLAVARVITPMLAARFLTPHKGEPEKSRMLDWYLGVAAWALQHRRFVMIAATGFFLGSLALVLLLPTSFITASDRSQTQLTVEIAPGSTLEETRRTVVDKVLAITRNDSGNPPGVRIHRRRWRRHGHEPTRQRRQRTGRPAQGVADDQPGAASASAIAPRR